MRATCRRTVPVAAAFAALSLMIGCAPAASLSASPLATASPATPSIRSSVSPTLPSSPSPGPSASLVAMVIIDEPALSMRLPPAWQTLSSAMLRSQFERSATIGTATAKASYAELIRQIDAGEIRGGASGPSGFEAWQGTMVIGVTKAASVDAQIARIDELQVAFTKLTSRERTTVALPIGPAERVMATADPPAGQPGVGVAARGIAWYVDLGDGRIFWVTTTGPAESATFERLIDDALSSLDRR